MKKIISKAFFSVLLFIILLVAVLSFLLTTTPGLYTSIRLGKLFIPGSLTMHHLTGRLLDEFSIDGLVYTHKNMQITVNQLKSKWHVASWKNFKLDINKLTADCANITINKLSQTLNTISLTGTLDFHRIKVDALSLYYLKHPVNAQFQLDLQAPHTLSGTLKLTPNKQSPFKFNLDVFGNLKKLQWKGVFGGPQTGTFTGHLMDNLRQGQLALKLNPGQIALPENSLLPALEHKGGTLNALLSPKSLSGTGLLTIDPNKHLNLSFNAPQLDLNKGLSDKQPVTGQLELSIKSLDFLRHLTPDINNPQGQLSAILHANGNVSNLALETQFHLSQGSFSLPVLGLNLHAIDIKATGKGKHWEGSGILHADNKTLHFKGRGPIGQELGGDISLEGTEFPLVNTREYQISANPHLNIKLMPSHIDITGAILIPKARIAPQTFTNSLTLSDDVIYKNVHDAPPSFLNTSMNLVIEMGKDVQLTLKGLQATLDGKVHVQQAPRGPINATGELSVVKGQYKAYGQDLAVEQGQLIFTGGRIDNPGINLRASKKINNANTALSSNTVFDFNTSSAQQINLGSSITAGVEVTGRLTSPTIRLFSNPALLSQADILSFLVIGRPASEANQASGQLLLTAISSMNLGKNTHGAQLLEQLKQSAGLDFSVKPTTNFNQSTKQFTNTSALVVGKSLSKRLYLSYNVGLSQSDTNVLTLKYLLNKFYSIQVSGSTTAKGIDLLYSKEKK